MQEYSSPSLIELAREDRPTWQKKATKMNRHTVDSQRAKVAAKWYAMIITGVLPEVGSCGFRSLKKIVEFPVALYQKSKNSEHSMTFNYILKKFASCVQHIEPLVDFYVNGVATYQKIKFPQLEAMKEFNRIWVGNISKTPDEVSKESIKKNTKLLIKELTLHEEEEQAKWQKEKPSPKH